MEQHMIDLAVQEGFSAAAIVDTQTIPFDSSFRPYCEENLCGQYAVNYSCPPACGTPEEMKQKIHSHRRAMVLQTLWEISDYTDSAAIKKAKASHNTAQIRLVKQLRQQGIDGFLVGASGCALCSPCALQYNEPCKFPEYQYSCMSAYCIFVKQLMDQCGIEYNCGDGLLAFFGMYVFG